MNRNRLLNTCFWSGVGLSALATFGIALQTQVASHDAYQFLAQAKRLSDPAFDLVPYGWQRPRGLVFILYLYNKLFSVIVTRHPNLPEYHVLMAVLSSLCPIVWRNVGIRLFSRNVGNVTGLLFVIYPLFHRLSMRVLSDCLTTLLWGIVVLAFLRCMQWRWKPQQWFVLGVLSAFLALSKYQYFFLPLLFMAIFYFLYLKAKRLRSIPDEPYMVRNLGGWFLSFVVSVELGQRLLGPHNEGFWHTIRLHYQVTRDTMRGAGQPMEPWDIYFSDFYHSFGLLFILAVLVSLYFAVPARKQLLEDPPWKRLALDSWLMTQVIYMVWTQLIPHREPRYMLPMIPGFFVVVGVGLVHAMTYLKIWQQRVALSLGAIALFHPIKLDVDIYLDHYRANLTYDAPSAQAFWDFLRAPNENGKPCEYVFACRLDNATETLDFPNYQYHMPWLSPHVIRCDGEGKNEVAVKEKLRAQIMDGPRPEACYVYRASSGRVVVEKALTGKDELANRSIASQLGEHMGCESSGGKRQCYFVREFF